VARKNCLKSFPPLAGAIAELDCYRWGQDFSRPNGQLALILGDSHKPLLTLQDCHALQSGWHLS
jgi:hypothetical protein